VYDERIETHQKIFENAQESRIRSALNVGPFLAELERKSEALAMLTKSASEVDEGRR
jgi:hypothetical protein